jgi:hypothetical protein
MVLGLILGWTIKALDFDNTFVQAEIDHEVFGFLPRGYYSMIKTQIGDKACLKLKKVAIRTFSRSQTLVRAPSTRTEEAGIQAQFL